MQITLKDRATESGATTIFTPPVDLSGMSQFTFSITVHTVAGTGPTLALSFVTSDNLENWKAIGSSVNQDAAGTTIGSLDAKTDDYGRYVRAQIALGGTDPIYNYSVYMNTFSST